MFVFDLPEVGEGVIEGELVKWLVSIGDTIEEDQPICELMTDKATIEITSPKSGLVHKLHCDVGDTIEVHTPLIEINTGGSAAPSIKKEETPQQKPAAAIQKPPTPVAPVIQKTTPQPQPSAKTTKVLASPAVRAFANRARRRERLD